MTPLIIVLVLLGQPSIPGLTPQESRIVTEWNTREAADAAGRRARRLHPRPMPPGELERIAWIARLAERVGLVPTLEPRR